MAPGQHAPDAHRNLTGNYNFNYRYHPITVRQNRENGAQILNHLIFVTVFKALVCVEYGGFASLHEATWNYQNNWVAAFNHSEDACMSYEKGLRNLIVFLFTHYIEAFECHGAWQGHQAILAMEYLMVADTLGRYHHWYKRANLRKPGIEKTWLPHQWKITGHLIFPDWQLWVAQTTILWASTGTRPII